MHESRHIDDGGRHAEEDDTGSGHAEQGATIKKDDNICKEILLKKGGSFCKESDGKMMTKKFKIFSGMGKI